jgi:glycosyltransferase involved in cell wall biosynthesis
VHDHGFLPLPRLPVPTCLLVHDLRAVDGDSRWPRWLARRIVRASCTRASAVVTPSAWTAARLRELVPEAPPPVVVPNGVVLPGEVLPLQPPPPAAGYLLHVGHVEARKNLAIVVDALARLPADARPELWLAGRDAGTLPRLLAHARDLGVRVHSLGVVDDAALTSLYGHARAVVMPSRHEGFGLPALEALAHGRPVLVSSAGALPEVVGACARPLPPADARAWAQAITELGTCPFDAEPARRRAAQFSWRTAASGLLALWRRLSG